MVKGGREYLRHIWHLAHYGIALAVLVAIWQVLALTLGTNMLPEPADTVLAFLRALATADFWADFAASTWRAGAAMLLAWILGFPLGVLMGGNRKVDAVLAPMVFLTYPIPKIVLLPIVLLLFGLGDSSKILLISVILGYQVLVASRDGVRGLHPKYLDSVRSLGAGSLRLYLDVMIPAALPHGFTALRLNSGVSVAVLFFVESFATERGLGHQIMDAWGRMDYTDMFVGIFGMSILGVLLYESADLLERRVCAWKA